MKGKFLTPLVRSDSFRKSEIYFCDFETTTVEGKHYVICFSIIGEDFQKVGLINMKNFQNGWDLNLLREESENLLTMFFEIIFSLKRIYSKKDVLVYFHNMARFDGYFVLEFLGKDPKNKIDIHFRESKLYYIKVERGGQLIEIRDSYLLLSGSLRELSESYNSTEIKEENHLKKLDFVCEDTTINNLILNENNLCQNLIRYCLNDSIILSKIFLKFESEIWKIFNLSITKSYTISGLAFKLFRLNFYKNFNIENLSGVKYSFIKDSYKGGKNEVYKPHLIDGFYYDVNSLYPFVMKENYMPEGEGTWVEGNLINLENFFGFLEVTLYCPDMNKPFLCVNTEEGLISPIGSIRGTFFSEEIKYSLTLGYKIIKINRGLLYNKKKMFEDFVDTVYKLRKQEQNPFKSRIFKLILNSLYGRFGMKKNSSFSKIIKKEELDRSLFLYNVQNYFQLSEHFFLLEFNSLNKSRIHSAFMENKIDELTFLSLEKHEKNSVFYSGSHCTEIAAAITSYARIHMHQFISDEKLDVYYTDTDSIFCKNILSDNLVSSDTLGLFKLECEIKEAYFLAPKVYCYKDSADFNFKVKGLPNDIPLDKNMFNHFLDKELDQEEKHPLIFNFLNHFKRNNKNFSINKIQTQFTLNPKLLKRNKLYLNNKWVSTTPTLFKIN